MNPSCNLFIVGPTGAGKTSIGRRLAEHYQLAFVDLDQEIERHCGVPVGTVFALEGEAGFRRRESEMLDQCTQRQGIVLATGAGAVLDPSNRRQLAARGYVLWLQAGIDAQLERLARDTKRPLLAGEDRRARLTAMREVREPLYRALADLALPDEHANVHAATQHAITLIDTHWNRTRAA